MNLTDLSLNEYKDIHLNDANDLAVVTGQDQLEQSTAIDVLDVLTDFVGSNVSGEQIGQLETAIQSALEDDPQVTSVQNVSVSTFNTDTGEVAVDVSVLGDNDFTLSLS